MKFVLSLNNTKTCRSTRMEPQSSTAMASIHPETIQIAANTKYRTYFYRRW